MNSLLILFWKNTNADMFSISIEIPCLNNKVHVVISWIRVRIKNELRSTYPFTTIGLVENKYKSP